MDMFNVFLSSTALDLGPHRQAAKEAIDSLDGFHCVRMEEFGSRDATSQAFCAERVEECDVFVILLGHLYGSGVPSASISFTESEYDEAIKREKPVLRFAAPEDFQVPNNLIESAAKRKKQQQFRKRVLTAGQAKFFNSPEDVARGIITALHNWKEGRPDSGVQGNQSFITQHEMALPSHVGSEVSQVDAIKQFLKAHAVISETTNEILSNHQANLAYRFRELLDLESKSLNLLHKTLFSDHHGLVPGWYWVQGETSENLATILWAEAYRDPTVRQGVLSLAKRNALALPEDRETRHDVLKEFLVDERFGVADVALSLMTVRDDASLVSWGEEKGLSGRSDLSTAFEWFQLQCRFENDPTDGFDALLSSKRMLQRTEEKLSPLLTRVSTDHLIRSLGESAPGARVVAIRELISRQQLGREQARLLTLDSHPPIVELALRALIEQGEIISVDEIREKLKTAAPKNTPFPMDSEVEDDLVFQSLLALDEGQLRGKVGWLEQDGRIAYRILGERHFDSFGEQLRSDLAERFASMRGERVSSLRTQVEAELRKSEEYKSGRLTDELIVQALDKALGNLRSKDFEGLDDFIEGRFIESALRGLVRHGGPEDIGYARSLLDDPKDRYYSLGQVEAIELVRKFGDASDVNRLIQLFLNSYGVVQDQAGRTALLLSEDKLQTARAILEGPAEALYEVALRALPPGEKTDELMTHYMFVKQDGMRELAATEAARRWEPAKALEFLNWYVEQGSYYYNVVVVFDRALFAPETMRVAFRSSAT